MTLGCATLPISQGQKANKNEKKMGEEKRMSDEIIKVIDHLAEKMGIAVDWTADNVLPKLQDTMDRYVKYLVMKDTIWIIASVIVLILAIALLLRFADGISDDEYIMLCGTIAIVAIVVIVFCSIHIAKCKTVPEIIMYEYVRGQVE